MSCAGRLHVPMHERTAHATMIHMVRRFPSRCPRSRKRAITEDDNRSSY